MNNAFGSFVRTQRMKQGFNGREFAKRVGITAAQLSNVETGKCLPLINAVNKYSTALNLPLETLTDLWISDYESK